MLSKNSLVFSFLVGSVALAGAPSARAQEVSATKTAPAKTIIRNDSADIQLRHYFKSYYEGDNYNKEDPSAQVRSNIGFKLFDDKLSSTVTLGANKYTNTNAVTQRRTEVWNEVVAVEGTYGSVKPFLWLLLPQSGKGTVGNLGVVPTAKYPIETTAGTITLKEEVTAFASFASREEDATVTNPGDRPERFGLVGEPESSTEISGQKDDPSYENWYDTSVSFQPTLVKGLDLQLHIWVTNKWEPKYTFNEDGSRNVAYANSQTTDNVYKVVYKATDKVKLVNEFWHRYDGLYESRGNNVEDEPRFTNIAYVAYTLY